MVAEDLGAPSVEKTLALIKADAVGAGHAREIMQLIELTGFCIVDRKLLKMTQTQAEEFYGEHVGKPFFQKLVKFMTSGPIWALVLAKPNAIQAWRALMGPTDSNRARQEQPKSIRGLYGTDGTFNAAHGSDSPESAFREIHFFFPGMTVDQPIDQDSSAAYIQEASTYIQKNLEPVLLQALTVVAKEKPSGEKFEAITFLANWLLDNNPNKPRVALPGACVPDSMNVEAETDVEVGATHTIGNQQETSSSTDRNDVENKKVLPSKIPVDDTVVLTEVETQAVVKIQSVFRGHQARKEVQEMIENNAPQS